MPTLLLLADHDAISIRHIAEFFALFDGGVRDTVTPPTDSRHVYRLIHW